MRFPVPKALWFAAAAPLVVGALLYSPGQVKSPPLDEQEARTRFAQTMPRGTQLAFLEIPWRLDMKQAIAEGQAADKPILVWHKRGNPLGTT